MECAVEEEAYSTPFVNWLADFGSGAFAGVDAGLVDGVVSVSTKVSSISFVLDFDGGVSTDWNIDWNAAVGEEGLFEGTSSSTLSATGLG